MSNDVSTTTTSTQTTSYASETSATDQANVDQATTEFSNMSVEDIMFLVLTKRAEEQKKNIEAFAAQVQANTLKATNFNNFKAAIDNAAKNSDGADVNDIQVTWENENGTTETISASEAADRLGYSQDTLDSAITAGDKEAGDQAAVDADKAQYDKDGGDWNAFWGGTAYSDKQQMNSDQSTLDNDKKAATISQDDLETLSANLANAHDKIEGDNQIAMAQLQKDMDDYQTTLQTVSSSTTSMAQLAQKIGGSVGQ